MRADVLTVTSLTRRFGEVRALDDIDLCLRTVEVLGLIGPNGAGKTTLMACIAGFDAPDAPDARRVEDEFRVVGNDWTR
jgi:ABC-type branched-subunit amino acid transport system ATPase component